MFDAMMFGVPLVIIMAGAVVGMAAWLGWRSLRMERRKRRLLVAGGVLAWGVLLFTSGWCDQAVKNAEGAGLAQTLPNPVAGLTVTVEQTGGHPPFGGNGVANWQAPVGGVQPTGYVVTGVASLCDESGNCASVNLAAQNLGPTVTTYTWDTGFQVFAGDDLTVGFVVRACNGSFDNCNEGDTASGNTVFRERGILHSFDFTLTPGSQSISCVFTFFGTNTRTSDNFTWQGYREPYDRTCDLSSSGPAERIDRIGFGAIAPATFTLDGQDQRLTALHTEQHQATGLNSSTTTWNIIGETTAGTPTTVSLTGPGYVLERYFDGRRFRFRASAQQTVTFSTDPDVTTENITISNPTAGTETISAFHLGFVASRTGSQRLRGDLTPWNILNGMFRDATANGETIMVNLQFDRPGGVENLAGSLAQSSDVPPFGVTWPVTWDPPHYDTASITGYRVVASAEVCSEGGQCQTIRLQEQTLGADARGYTWTPTHAFQPNDTITGTLSVQACIQLCSVPDTIQSTLTPRRPLEPGFPLEMIEYVGSVGVLFDRILDAADGGPGVVIAYELTGNIPEGMTFDRQARRLRGSPEQPGTYEMFLNARGTGGRFDQLEVRLQVAPAGSGPVFAAPSQSYTAAVGMPFSETLPEAAGGQGGLTYSLAAITFSVRPPPGLSVNVDTRVMSGTPTEEGVRSFIWRATDGRGRTADMIITVDVSSDALAFRQSSYELTFLAGQEIETTLPFAQGGEPPIMYALEGTIPAGTTYVASDNSLTGRVAGLGLHTAVLTATDSAGTPATATARISFVVASPFDGTEAVLDGQRYTSAAPVITRTEVRERRDGAEGVIVALWWESELPNSGHEIEQTLHGIVSSSRSTDLGNQTDVFLPEDEGTARYRVRTFLTNTSDHRVEVMAAGRRVLVAAGATVYSAWSETAVVGWGEGRGIAVDVDTDGPVDPGEGRMRPPLAVALADVFTTLGMPERGIDPSFALLTGGAGLAALVLVVALTGATLPGVFLGSSFATLLWFSGGTFLLGVPWYVFGAPLAVLVTVTVVFYVRRGAA